MEWKPIETAPKDGTCILLAAYTPGGTVIISDHWSEETNWWCDWYDGHSIPATHWMPLPPPPRSEGK